MVPDLAARDAALAAFEAKKAGILDAIKHQLRRSRDTAKEEGEFDALAREAPRPIAVPRLLYADATPEALAHALGMGGHTSNHLAGRPRGIVGQADLLGDNGRPQRKDRGAVDSDRGHSRMIRPLRRSNAGLARWTRAHWLALN